MPRPFGVALASAGKHAQKLGAALGDAILAADASPLVRHRDAAAVLRTLLPHIDYIALTIGTVETAQPAIRRRLDADNAGDSDHDA